MKTTIKRECGEDNLTDRSLTGEEDELLGDVCSDTPAAVDGGVSLEGQKAPNLPLHSFSDGNNNEREGVGCPGSLILAPEKESSSRCLDADDTMPTLNEEAEEPDAVERFSLEADEDATDLMTAICRVLPELQALNSTCARRHSFEFRPGSPTETGGRSIFCRRGTAPSLLFVSPQVTLGPEHDDSQQSSVCSGALDACLAQENGSAGGPRTEMERKEQNDMCCVQTVEDHGKTKETVPETSATFGVTIQDCVASGHPGVESVSECRGEPGGEVDEVLEREGGESEGSFDQSEENSVPMEDHDADQDYELEIAVGGSEIESSSQTDLKSTADEELVAATTAAVAPQSTPEEPHYAVVVKGRAVAAPPEGVQYANCQVTTSEVQGGISVPSEVEAESLEHVYDIPKEVKEGSGAANDESHGPEGSVSGVCTQEAGCEGTPATSEPIYETIEEGNERSNNNEGNGPESGKPTPCV